VRAAFLEELATTGMVRAALACVKCGPSAAYALRRRDPEFRAAWDAALADAVVPVESMLVERALAGERVRTLDADGRTIYEQHRYDGRFALRLLTRLDRKADKRARATPTGAKSLINLPNPLGSAQSAQQARFSVRLPRP
jgi:hypothetical protein